MRALRTPLIRLEDAALNGRFWIQNGRRTTLVRQLADCATLDDYYDFAARAFGPHQVRSEILALLRRLAPERPRNVCEIGTADGGTNALLMHALPTAELMIGIDLFVKGKRRLRHFAAPRHHLHYIDGSSQAPATVARAQSLLAGRELDVLFIDGDHTYEGVRQDFLCYRPFVREGGFIVFHDICPDFRTRYEQRTGNWVGDVPRFWERLRTLYTHEVFVEDADQDGFGIGMLRYSRHVAVPADL